MLELARTEAAFVSCMAAPEALDAVHAAKTETLVRVAPDELLLIGALGSGPKVAAASCIPSGNAIPMNTPSGKSIETATRMRIAVVAPANAATACGVRAPKTTSAAVARTIQA